MVHFADRTYKKFFGGDFRTLLKVVIDQLTALPKDPSQMAAAFPRHAGYVLNVGVTEEELKQVVYLTTVHARFPRAIEAAQTLGELFDERPSAAGGNP
jgi:alkylhydroperoxidase/carboxymuconolactone decarboxylase family protein YurZ